MAAGVGGQPGNVAIDVSAGRVSSPRVETPACRSVDGIEGRLPAAGTLRGARGQEQSADAGLGG